MYCQANIWNCAWHNAHFCIRPQFSAALLVLLPVPKLAPLALVQVCWQNTALCCIFLPCILNAKHKSQWLGFILLQSYKYVISWTYEESRWHNYCMKLQLAFCDITCTPSKLLVCVQSCFCRWFVTFDTLCYMINLGSAAVSGGFPDMRWHMRNFSWVRCLLSCCS